ncbi:MULTISPECIES: acyltransferase family protein [Streptomyces]|uniref:Membrane protein n=1 Tax=Streptomyces coelicolor (strain ATCC BAA-471 / A3(2) / M145) TaxID=100226 RepID=Q9WX28_STRCO|nr:MULTISPECIES: acyltransferase [Streptomyces]MYU42828.1 acyltransferase family protein [Streptomyces sp. SID7813]MDX2930300.1 acyltransferase [Streptomyces sp. NRRL_B-16638]QFI43365.1 acyltransferase [Streptomyces coelicolor A3(2)]TYP01663.1 peptidoglycan/LPS O-acetylase OafA/YrhL [Streptomyces coelicolor]TYP04367.1 peptidoglycan/LPS O-acetylase OafA/YrhL [Streptomyces coelicolor A3(2)]
MRIGKASAGSKPADAPRGSVGQQAPRGRIGILDGLRLCAALMVVLYHYVAFGGGWEGSQAQLFPVLFRPSAYGWLGVELFFMISGFVICMSSWGRSVSHFFTSRVIRLFPAYWLAIAVTTAVVFFMPGGITPLPWRDLLVNLTMLQRPMGVDEVEGVYWTLWAEMRFYLLFALVVWRGVTYRRVVVFCCVWATAAVVAKRGEANPISDLVMAQDCWFFIAGLAFYLMYRFGQNLLLWGMIAFCFAMGNYTAMTTWRATLDNVGDNVPDWGVAVVLTVFFVTMAGVALGWFRRVDWRWLPTAGALTYPLYLLHESIGWEVFHRYQYTVNQWVLVGGTLAGVLVLSYLVHRLVEKPMSKRLKTGLAKAFDQIRAEGATHHERPPTPVGPVRPEPGPPGSGPPGSAPLPQGSGPDLDSPTRTLRLPAAPPPASAAPPRSRPVSG